MAEAPIVVGYDGSPESRAAADWALEEAASRDLPLELLHAWHPPAVPGRSDADRPLLNQLLGTREAELRLTGPGVDVYGVPVPDPPVKALVNAASRATMLVMGSRGLGALRGFVVGSVSNEVLGRGTCPMVLVRAPAEKAGNGGASRSAGLPVPEVLVGLDLQHTGEVLPFSFRAAALRGAPLHVVHSWGPPPGSEYMAFGSIGAFDDEMSATEEERLEAELAPWRRQYPEVEVEADLRHGHAAVRLVDAADGAQLVVVGRRHRMRPALPRLGPVTHAVVHHVRCPVAVVPEPQRR